MNSLISAEQFEQFDIYSYFDVYAPLNPFLETRSGTCARRPRCSSSDTTTRLEISRISLSLYSKLPPSKNSQIGSALKVQAIIWDLLQFQKDSINIVAKNTATPPPTTTKATTDSIVAGDLGNVRCAAAAVQTCSGGVARMPLPP